MKAQVSDQRVYHETQHVLNQKNIINKNKNQEIKKNSELSVSRNCCAGRLKRKFKTHKKTKT